MPNWHFWWLFELLDTCCLLDNNKWKLNGHKLMLIDKLQFVSLFSIRCAGNECEIALNRNGHRRAVSTATTTIYSINMAKVWIYFFVLVWISYLMSAGIHLFSRGFLLSRRVQTQRSTCTRLQQCNESDNDVSIRNISLHHTIYGK